MLLSDLDNLYKTTISKLPKEQRLWYCTRHLDKIQHAYTINITKMKTVQQQKMQTMIRALNEEIKLLNKM